MVCTNFSLAYAFESRQSIGFFGPGLALVCLTTARSPFVASAWLTVAVGLKAFSHCGFLVNLQVSIFSASSFANFPNIWLIQYCVNRKLPHNTLVSCMVSLLLSLCKTIYIHLHVYLFVYLSYLPYEHTVIR